MLTPGTVRRGRRRCRAPPLLLLPCLLPLPLPGASMTTPPRAAASAAGATDAATACTRGGEPARRRCCSPAAAPASPLRPPLRAAGSCRVGACVYCSLGEEVSERVMRGEARRRQWRRPDACCAAPSVVDDCSASPHPAWQTNRPEPELTVWYRLHGPDATGRGRMGRPQGRGPGGAAAAAPTTPPGAQCCCCCCIALIFRRARLVQRAPCFQHRTVYLYIVRR